MFDPRIRRRIDDLAASQAGVVARHQLLALGLTSAQAHQPVESGRWQRLLPGVHATFTGPVPDLARVWAAILYAGDDARASHGTALWLLDRSRPVPLPVHVSVPHRRRVRPQPGLVVHVRRPADRVRVGRPPRTPIEDAVLDVTSDTKDVESVLSLVFRVTQRRWTSSDRILAALHRRRRHRWRPTLEAVLVDVADGVTSPLEHEYLRRVEGPHGLPRGIRNRPEDDGGRRVLRDVRYAGLGTVIELDGREAHPAQERFRDMRRDNRLVVQGEAAMRFGWHDVRGRPCEAAIQVAVVLRSQGWQGRPVSCGPGCAVLREDSFGPGPN